MRGGSDCCGNFCVIRPIEGNPRQSRILDSTPWVPDSRYWTPFFAVELGLWFPMVSGILDSLSCVPNPKGQDFGFHIKITLDSIFHQQKFPGFIKDRTGGGAAVGALVQPPPPPPLFQMVIFFFILWLPRSVTYHTNKLGLVISQYWTPTKREQANFVL